MGNRICHSMLALLFVDGLSVAILLVLMPKRPALSAMESPPALVAPDQKIPEQIPKDIMKRAEVEGMWTNPHGFSSRRWKYECEQAAADMENTPQ